MHIIRDMEVCESIAIVNLWRLNGCCIYIMWFLALLVLVCIA